MLSSRHITACIDAAPCVYRAFDSALLWGLQSKSCLIVTLAQAEIHRVSEVFSHKICAW